MTLTKPNTTRKPTGHRKRTGQHHKQGRHYVKAYWPYLPMIAILTASFLISSRLTNVHQSVLGYATDISIPNLLQDTNAQRSTNSEAALALDAQLDQAAQAKANDMVARDYWSHDTPDDQTPWTFISATGYNYQTAGENLAYGFDTSADTITGWMNSTEHRANILNTTFQAVGFGIANAANYQGTGPQTIVVAMYATPTTPPVPITTAPRASTPTQGKPTAPTTSAAAAVPATPTPAPIANQTNTPAPQSTPSKKVLAHRVTEPAQKRVPRIQLVAANVHTSWILGVTILLSVSALFTIVLRHTLAWRKTLLRGEAFVLHHPVFDITATLIVAAGIVLTQTVGLIR